MERTGFELYNAAKDKEVSSSTLRSLLERVTCKGNTILHLAVNFENKDIAEKILKLDRTLLYETNNKGDTPLHIAARFGYAEMVELLIKYRKQDVEQGMKLLKIKNSEEDTALSEEDTALSEKDTALHVAVRKGEKEIVKLLINDDPTLAMKTNEAKESPLFLAVDREFYDIALKILELKECSPEGRKNMNALHAAVMDKCKPTQADDSGWIPLHYAAHLGDVELVKLFLEKDTSLAYMTEEKGMSALHISANKGHVDVMDTLIKRCPDTCELLDNKGRTALHYAVESGKPETVKFLLRKEEFQNLINEQDEEGNTPLHLAAYRGYAIIVHRLSRSRKVDNVIQNKKDMTALDILRSTTQKNILFWLADETATNGEGHGDQNKVSKKEHSVDIGGNNKEKTEAPLQKPQDQAVQKARDQHEQKEKSSEILASTSLMVATIIATVAFQAACQVPGGYNGGGEPNLKENNSFKRFMKFNSVSFGLSAFLMCFQFIVAILPRYFHIPYPRLFIFLLSELSLLCMVGAFLSALYTQNSEPSDSAATGTYVALFLPLFPFMLIFYAHYILKHIWDYKW
ncbi:ankyrin repeat-containing protein [Quercus suber]|uniref:Ankyrin repeat-containing protein n=1 Tax=Quercus suber TaxID=58331 RepID=A0AAW0IVV0_QUESU